MQWGHKIDEKIEIDSSKLVGITTNKALSSYGKKMDLLKDFCLLLIQDSLVSHCIIHQENLCKKYWI